MGMVGAISAYASASVFQASTAALPSLGAATSGATSAVSANTAALANLLSQFDVNGNKLSATGATQQVSALSVANILMANHETATLASVSSVAAAQAHA